MYFFPISVINKVAEESRSGRPAAPVVPHEPPRLSWFSLERRLERATRRSLRRAGRAHGTDAAAALCEAEPRDRSPKVAGAPRTC
ncbi:hypothetical protein F1D05_18520 [Kribbella qitaiheensis]|uniref:Uncharacterized protein n=1 Tax=Kribbella qitaiheensis TaxID=1544730 RepID=A0A7G6WZY2_9ACTN|nr:hypothetical protein [Kribbella qitaiheensis]QNE19547.1 hypothetical protein F1D05_18520 [Kribbella qitaiheensis]